MKRLRTSIGFVKLLYALPAILLIISAAQGHVPVIAKGNENLSSATYIPDIAKSWAIYDQLEGRPQYVSFDVQRGQRIYASLLIPTDPRLLGFRPEMILLGPGLQIQGSLREDLQVPQGYGALEIPSFRTEEATYEPFGPSSFYQLSEVNITAPEDGRYYLAVVSNRSGSYSIALGYLEEFTLGERIATPLRLISIYRWEGQSLAYILAPTIIAALAGLWLAWRKARQTPFSITGTLGGALLVGWSATVLSQIIYNLMRAPNGSEVYISLALAALPAIFGVIAFRLSMGEAGLLQRSILAILGSLGLIGGFGLILGPVLAIASSVLPSRQT